MLYMFPTELSSCRNVLCDIHNDAIDELYDSIVSACIKATQLSIPATPTAHTGKRIAGWSEHVKPYKDRSVFWYKLWLDTRGLTMVDHAKAGFHTLMLKSRAEYKRISRQVIRAQNRYKMERMAEGLLHNSKRDFWQEVSRVSKSNKGCTSVVDEIHGEVDISTLFRNKYEHLYTSVPYDQSEMQNIVNKVNHDVHAKCHTGECPVIHDIEVNDIMSGIAKLKLFKGDALFELSSNNLLYGCDELSVLLCTLFNGMLSHGYCPKAMSVSSLIPIPKSTKKSINNSSNYRAIAIGSVIGKVLDHVIMSKNIDMLCTSDLQFGFKPKSSTTQCSFVLQEVVDLYERNDSTLYLILLDASPGIRQIKLL